ncbi:MAG TPA: hypothetical protein VLE99_02815 [Candidatus Saccharimonadales bacterium]|nr:hypothetical protein [Candidatus Saccharimonadales bacterium]
MDGRHESGWQQHGTIAVSSPEQREFLREALDVHLARRRGTTLAAVALGREHPVTSFVNPFIPFVLRAVIRLADERGISTDAAPISLNEVAADVGPATARDLSGVSDIPPLYNSQTRRYEPNLEAIASERGPALRDFAEAYWIVRSAVTTDTEADVEPISAPDKRAAHGPSFDWPPRRPDGQAAAHDYLYPASANDA